MLPVGSGSVDNELRWTYKRMHIVHVEDFFHPDAGYQLNLLSRLQKIQGQRVTIITGEIARVPDWLIGFFGGDDIAARDRAFEAETGVAVIRRPLHAFISGRAIFGADLIRFVDGLAPDVAFIHGESTLTGIRFTLAAPRLSYPIVIDSHMLAMASRNPFARQFQAAYRRFIAPRILRQQIPLIRVQDSDYVERFLGIPLAHTDLLSFGSDTLLFRPDPEARATGRHRLGIPDHAFVVVYAGKLDGTKGGPFLADALSAPLAGLPERPIHFVIVGNAEGPDAGPIEALFQSSSNPLKRLPTQRYRDLPGLYQLADLVVFPKQCSLSFFDVQAAGVPVLFEDNEINLKRVVGDNARVFRSGDREDFRNAIMALASLPDADLQRMRAAARSYVVDHYDYVKVAAQYTEILERARDSWLSRRRSA